MSSLALGIQPGELVDGKYRLGALLGQGGMGVVIAAVHEQLDQPVALKVLLPEAASPEVVQRFLREARSAVKIQSEHVARVFDVGTLPSGAPYMVMEHLQGQDLSALLKERGPLPVADAVGFVLEATEAIAEAHALGIVHRDLKPANLFLARRPSGRPVIKVLDFGISKILSATQDGSLTSTHGVMGSPLYMSPEQMVAARQVDARSDIWSLGVVLYELLTHAVPFDGDTMPEVVAAILSLTPRALGELRPDIPYALQAVIARCLQKEPALRFQNLTELARALLPFAPPGGAISVERVEHLLGEAKASIPDQKVLPGAPTAMSVTYPPMVTLLPGGSPRRAWIVPALLFATLVLVGAIVGAIALRLHRASLAIATAAATTAATMPQPPAVVPSAAVALPPSTALLAAPSAPPAPSASASASPPPSASVPPAHGSAKVHAGNPPPAVTTAAPATTAATTASGASACHTESFFDVDGNKHFKQVCP